MMLHNMPKNGNVKSRLQMLYSLAWLCFKSSPLCSYIAVDMLQLLKKYSSLWTAQSPKRMI